MEAEPTHNEQTSESPSGNNEDKSIAEELSPTANGPVAAPATTSDLATSSVQPNAKDTPKANSKKPKKRKPKVPRDVTAPRQPLTGETSISLYLDQQRL